MMSIFTDSEKDSLRLFCHVCDEILECRFIKDLPKQSHSIEWSKLSDGTEKFYQPIYDRDDLRSYMTIFRKLLLEKELTNVYRILNILGRRAENDTERGQLKQIKKSFQSIERGHFSFKIGTKE